MLSEEENNENGNNAYGFSELWSQGILWHDSPDCFAFDECWNLDNFFTKFLDQRRIYTHANELKS